MTSFGLDFLVHDQQGGDVDSIRSVRSAGFKSEEHRAAYEAREAYDTKAYDTKAYHTHTPEVDRAIADADNVREQMKKEIAA